MPSHIIPHRGIDYAVTALVAEDGATVLEVELEYATWRSDWYEAVEDLTDLGRNELRSFWPSTAPEACAPVPDGLAAFLFGMVAQEEVQAAVAEEITDTKRAVEAAVDGGATR